MSHRKTYARDGGSVGCIAGLLIVWYIMAHAFDHNVSDHSDKFAFAVIPVCGFAVFCVLAATAVGVIVGTFIRRTDQDDSPE